MKNLIIYTLALMTTLIASGKELINTIDVQINSQTLICKANGTIDLLVPELEALVEGKYSDFKLQTTYVNANCLLTEYLHDKAQQNSGTLSANLRIQKVIDERPIYDCKRPRPPCSFCDPPDSECKIIGTESFSVETINLNLKGLSFSKKGEWKIK